MLKRKVFDILSKWKAQPNHKCLLLKGQRQVGKTFIVREFGKTYSHFIELDFIGNPNLKNIFKGGLAVDEIISKMKLHFTPSDFVPGETLLFFDEVQECPEARSSLKQFTMDGRYDVIASGSLLGVSDLHRGEISSVPVGYETHLEMKPMDFEEYLWARDIEQQSIDRVRSCLSSFERIDDAYYDVFRSLFREYLIIGGMPEAVQRYLDTHDYSDAHDVIDDILQSAISDINHYNLGVDRIKARDCFDSIPHQLDQTNKKFMYSRISGEGSRKSAEKYMGNLLWIKAAGYAVFCYSLYGMDLPLRVNRSAFRVYMSDTGMLCHMYGKNTLLAISEDDYSVNEGAIMENMTAVCLDKAGYKLMYYNKNSGDDRMELDFVCESKDGLTAIEVKSGSDRSFSSIQKAERYVGKHRFILHDGNISEESGIHAYPLFASAFISDLNE